MYRRDRAWRPGAACASSRPMRPTTTGPVLEYNVGELCGYGEGQAASWDRAAPRRECDCLRQATLAQRRRSGAGHPRANAAASRVDRRCSTAACSYGPASAHSISPVALGHPRPQYHLLAARTDRLPASWTRTTCGSAIAMAATIRTVPARDLRGLPGSAGYDPRGHTAAGLAGPLVAAGRPTRMGGALLRPVVGVV